MLIYHTTLIIHPNYSYEKRFYALLKAKTFEELIYWAGKQDKEIVGFDTEAREIYMDEEDEKDFFFHMQEKPLKHTSHRAAWVMRHPTKCRVISKLTNLESCLTDKVPEIRKLAKGIIQERFPK